MNVFQISILPIVDGDNAITIFTNQNNQNATYNFMSMKLSYSITNSSNLSMIMLDFNFPGNDNERILEGQLINIYAIADGATALQTIFVGFIRSITYKRSRQGTYAILKIDQILGQLTLLSSNSSWNDATQTYNTIFTNISGNQVNLIPFLNELATGSLISGISRENQDSLVNIINWWTFINGTAPVLPNVLWASCEPNKNRDEVVREILFPYNRILWQSPDGTLVIQPLFYDDKANDSWNLDLSENSQNNWLEWEVMENAGEMINRIDFQFAAILPFDQYDGNYSNGNNIYASSTANPKYYSRMAQLQQSGLYDTAILTQKALDTSILTDPSLMNALVNCLGQKNISKLNTNNVIHSSPNPKNNNTVPQIYASNEMAINNMKAHILEVKYDFDRMTDETDINPASLFLDMPLAKTIHVNSYGLLGYDSMLCFMCELDVGRDTGSNLTANFCPIESITGTWYNLT